MSKYPSCQCGTEKYDYFLKRYRNATLHLMRKCPLCGKAAQNAMRQDEYDRHWIEGLPIVENGVVVSQPSRAEQIQKKLENHITARNARQHHAHAN